MSRPALTLLLWIAALAGLGALVAGRLDVSGDLRLFMPTPRDADQRLLLDTLGEGPGSRLLLLALSGADPETLADHSRALRDALGDAAEIRRSSNGEDELDAIDPTLWPYRYLLSPGFDAAPLDAALLRGALQERLQDLGSPAAGLVEPWIARDPTLELLRLAELWQPTREPERYDGLWFSPGNAQALLVVETVSGGFDPQAQRRAVDAIRSAHAELQDGERSTLEISGPGAFSVLLHERTQGEATELGFAATAAIVLLLIVAYRSLRLPLLAALPVASGALAALATVSLLFGSIHGITLAFGFTLLGLAQDYPVHLLSHLRRDRSALVEVRRLWPTLATGVGSTCLAYLAFLASGVTGLSQLAAFAISGLLVAAACTRWLLPALLPRPERDVAGSAALGVLHAWVRRLPSLRLLPWMLGIVALPLLLTSSRPFWDDNLAHLTPVPAELLQRDGELREQLGAPDVRYLLVLQGADRERLLQAAEALQPELQSLVEHGVIAGFELPSQYLPSAARQRARQAALPEPAALASMIDAASRDLPFRAGLFAPFAADVETARSASPLDLAQLVDSPLGARLESLLPRGDGDRPLALIGLSGVADAAALGAFADAQGPSLHLLDLKAASESLAASYRERVLWALVFALIVLAASVGLLLREPSRVLRVIAPVVLATLVVLAGLHLAGIALNLFHLVSLILAAGLGLDYALFFEHAGDDRSAQRRTLHAVIVCALSTGLVFGLLASSSIPVLRAIGMTVAFGVLAQFLFAAIVAQHGARRHAAVA